MLSSSISCTSLASYVSLKGHNHRSDRHITLFPCLYIDRFVCLLESTLLEPCHQFAQRL